MTFVVGENCINCKNTDCVEVCPVDCFYEGPNFLVIHPDECIDCALCEPECPVDAIFSEDELPAAQQVFLDLKIGGQHGDHLADLGRDLGADAVARQQDQGLGQARASQGRAMARLLS